MISGSPPQFYIKTCEKKGPLPLKSNLNHSSAFPSFENLPVLIFTKLGEKCCLLLGNNSLQKKHQRKSRGRNFDGTRNVCNLHSFYNIALVLHKKMDSFSANQKKIIFHV